MWPQRKFNSLWNPRCMAHSRCLVNASWPEFCFLEFVLQRHLPKCIKMFTLVVMKGWTNPDQHPPRNLQSGLPSWLSHKESSCQRRKHGFNPWSGRIPRAKEQPSPVTTTIHLCSRAGEPQLRGPRATRLKPAYLEPMLCNERNHCSEKPMHCN